MTAMITVNNMKAVKGQWINDNVRVLEEPTFNEAEQRWEALAIVYGMLAIVELSVEEIMKS